MKRFRRLTGPSLLIVLLATTPALAQQEPNAVQLAGACQGCHGVTGTGSNGIPTIARQHTRGQFIAMMDGFRANRQPSTVMGRITRGYTDAEIAALATHFARQ